MFPIIYIFFFYIMLRKQKQNTAQKYIETSETLETQETSHLPLIPLSTQKGATYFVGSSLASSLLPRKRVHEKKLYYGRSVGQNCCFL